MTEEEFVAQLYDAIWNAGRHGEIAVQFDDGKEEGLLDQLPSTPWQWTVLGDRVFWFLQIRDHRPPTNGQPYQLDALHNFFPWAQELKLATPHRIQKFLQVLRQAMDSQTLGQHEAASDPEWRMHGEFLNPWAHHMHVDDQPPNAQHTMTEEQFLRSLYDCLNTRHRESRVPWNASKAWMPSRDKLHPPHPRFQDNWHWVLKGSREHW